MLQGPHSPCFRSGSSEIFFFFLCRSIRSALLLPLYLSQYTTQKKWGSKSNQEQAVIFRRSDVRLCVLRVRAQKYPCRLFRLCRGRSLRRSPTIAFTLHLTRPGIPQLIFGFLMPWCSTADLLPAYLTVKVCFTLKLLGEILLEIRVGTALEEEGWESSN